MVCGRDPVSLTEWDRTAICEPLYDAYRLGKYGAVEYLPMWHELDTKPTETPEAQALTAAVEAIVACHAAEAEASERRLRERIEALADECADSACIHLNTMYGRLRALLAEGGA